MGGPRPTWLLLSRGRVRGARQRDMKRVAGWRVRGAEVSSLAQPCEWASVFGRMYLCVLRSKGWEVFVRGLPHFLMSDYVRFTQRKTHSRRAEEAGSYCSPAYELERLLCISKNRNSGQVKSAAMYESMSVTLAGWLIGTFSTAESALMFDWVRNTQEGVSTASR